MSLDILNPSQESIGGDLYSPLRFGEFFKIDSLKANLFDALRERNKNKFYVLFNEIVEVRTKHKPSPSPNKAFFTLLEILYKNKIMDSLVFLKPKPKDNNRREKEEERERWEYDGRYVIQWIDLLAKEYGWTYDYISNLDINLVAHLIQEILVNDQLEKEWQYSLTEIAYKYDSGSKKSSLVPLNRPYWMRKEADAVIKTTKIKKSLLPHGVTSLAGIETPNSVE